MGVIALALLVYNETGNAAATAAIFTAAKFIPALLAPGLTARLDQLDLRRTLLARSTSPRRSCSGLLAFVADGRYVLRACARALLSSMARSRSRPEALLAAPSQPFYNQPGC